MCACLLLSSKIWRSENKVKIEKEMKENKRYEGKTDNSTSLFASSFILTISMSRPAFPYEYKSHSLVLSHHFKFSLVCLGMDMASNEISFISIIVRDEEGQNKRHSTE